MENGQLNGHRGASSDHPIGQAEDLELRWATDPRYDGIRRDYVARDVVSLRNSLKVEHTLATHGANRLWEALNSEGYIHTFGTLTGAQAVQMVAAGLRAIYVSGWQVAADANNAGHTYPDQSLYPSSSAPDLVRRINNALLRREQVDLLQGRVGKGWIVPVVADAEAGFGGPIHAFELMRSMIEAGAAGVHFEDQLAAEKNAVTWVARWWCRPPRSFAHSGRPAWPQTYWTCQPCCWQELTPWPPDCSQATSTSVTAIS